MFLGESRRAGTLQKGQCRHFSHVEHWSVFIRGPTATVKKTIQLSVIISKYIIKLYKYVIYQKGKKKRRSNEQKTIKKLKMFLKNTKTEICKNERLILGCKVNKIKGCTYQSETKTNSTQRTPSTKNQLNEDHLWEAVPRICYHGGGYKSCREIP